MERHFMDVGNDEEEEIAIKKEVESEAENNDNDNHETEDDDLMTPLESANSPKEKEIFDLSSECGTEKSNSWTSSLIRILLKKRLSMDELFETTTNKGPLWMIILNVLSEFSTFKLTVKDVQKKYHNLTTTYHRNKERAETKGPEAVTWEHFEIFDKIIGERTKLEINQSLKLQADEEAKKQELNQSEEPPPPTVTNTLFSGEYIPSKRKRKATHRYVEEIQVKEAEHKEKVKKEMEKRLSERKEQEKLLEEEQKQLMQFRSEYDRRSNDHANMAQRNQDRRRLEQNRGQSHLTPQQQQQQRIQQQRQQQIKQQQIKQQQHQRQQMINANNANLASNSNITLTSIGGNSAANTNRIATPQNIGNVTIMRLSEKERIWREKKALEERSLGLQEKRIAVEERKAKALEGLKSVVSEFLRRFEN